MTQTPPIAPSVLLVEDDPEISESLREILEEEGYGVACVANGLEAMDYLHSCPPPCVILLDLSMPVMNGWDFRARQMQDAALARIPVLVLSANGQQRLDAIQADGWVPKPFLIDQLLRAIERYCRA